MEIFKIIGIGLATCIAVLIVKQIKPEIAVVLSVAGGILIVLLAINSLSSVIAGLSALAEKTGLSSGLFSTVLKIVGIGYVTEFAANICSDSGSAGLADKILLAGKVVILVIAIPIMTNIIEIITGLLP
ncbi:MAG: stage III sporulation protein AD [Clostridia bacterium]